MVGDINLFLTPWEEDGDDESNGCGIGYPSLNESADSTANPKRGSSVRYCNGEVDIMIADRDRRGKGLGISAVSTLLRFVRRHLEHILAEYSKAQEGGPGDGCNLKDLVAKISKTNAGSIALFTKLGFSQRGEVNYFGEIEMVFEDFGRVASSPGVADEKGDAKGVAGYRELLYDRSRLN